MRLSMIMSFLLIVGIVHAQSGRIMGARAFQMDDGTGSGKTFTWDVSSPLNASYQLHFPNTPPSNLINYLKSDAVGNLTWVENMLPPLPSGNIWYGNNANIATPLAPTTSGAILSLGINLLPEWTNTLPLSMTVSASQISSGVLPPGTIIGVGPGARIEPVSSIINGPKGSINANMLSGSGEGKYSGKEIISTGANHLDISYDLISAFSSVTVSVFDPQAMSFGFVEAQVSQITAGVGFRVIFSAVYNFTFE